MVEIVTQWLCKQPQGMGVPPPVRNAEAIAKINMQLKMPKIASPTSKVLIAHAQ